MRPYFYITPLPTEDVGFGWSYRAIITINAPGPEHLPLLGQVHPTTRRNYEFDVDDLIALNHQLMRSPDDRVCARAIAREQRDMLHVWEQLSKEERDVVLDFAKSVRGKK